MEAFCSAWTRESDAPAMNTEMSRSIVSERSITKVVIHNECGGLQRTWWWHKDYRMYCGREFSHGISI